MKILFPSVFYLPEVMGGIELYIHHLAIGLQKKGYKVKVVVPAFTADAKNNYYLDGIEVVRYSAKHAATRLEFTGIRPNETLQNFKELIEVEKPDIIHFSQLTNSSGISLQHIEVAKKSGAKVIYTNHLSEFICQRGDLMYMGHTPCDGLVTVEKCTNCILNKRGIGKSMTKMAALFDKPLVRIVGEKNYVRQVKPFVLPSFFSRWQLHKITEVISSVDAFVSIAKWSNDLLQKNGWIKENCVTITTGLLNMPLEKRATINYSYDGTAPLKIIFIGRLFTIKGPDILIEATKGIAEHSVEVHIYGPKDNPVFSDYFNHCQDLAKGMQNVFFHEPVPNHEVVQLMEKYDVLCIPSRGNEMAPLVIQESVAAGIPVIGADLPAITEWVTDMKNGLIFSVGNAKDLRSRILQIIAQPSLLTSFRMKLPPIRNFETVINEYENLYHSVLTVSTD